MNKHYKAMVTLALFLVASMPLAVNGATAPPKVVFIGDQFTYLWGTTPGAFPANWINKGYTDYTLGENCFVNCEQGTGWATADRFQTDVINLHPAIVHIMLAADDADANDDASVPYVEPLFVTALQQMVQMAKTANIKVIFGLEGTSWSSEGGQVMAPLNSLVVAIAAQNNIPVINYGDELCGCVGSIGGGGVGVNFATGAQYEAVPLGSQTGGLLPTPAGYLVMTQMAATAINTMGLKLTGGYLQNVVPPDQRANGLSAPAINTAEAGTQNIIQFTPYGVYSGLTAAQPMLNDNFTGSTGTWASSNPLAFYINQQGLAWGLASGTSIITYTSPTGVKFSEWIMHN